MWEFGKFGNEFGEFGNEFGEFGDTLIETDWRRWNVDVVFTLAAEGDTKIPENRGRFANLVVGQQLHSTHIHKATLSDANKSICGTDGFVTEEFNLSLGIFTADCMAIYLYDIKNEKIGIVHAGWRGLKNKILSQLLSHFSEASKDADINAAISPHIKKCCYAVKEDVGLNFQRYFNDGFLDMTSVAIEQLNLSGITKISVAEFCTCCDNRFFSYRRDKTDKRHLAVIKKRPKQIKNNILTTEFAEKKILDL